MTANELLTCSMGSDVDDGGLLNVYLVIKFGHKYGFDMAIEPSFVSGSDTITALQR